MADLLLDNFANGTTDEEIRAFLVRYGFPEFDDIRHMPATASRPAALLSFRNAPPEALRSLLPRIHNLYWKNRKLQALVLPDRHG